MVFTVIVSPLGFSNACDRNSGCPVWLRAVWINAWLGASVIRDFVWLCAVWCGFNAVWINAVWLCDACCLCASGLRDFVWLCDACCLCASVIPGAAFSASCRAFCFCDDDDDNIFSKLYIYIYILFLTGSRFTRFDDFLLLAF